MQDKNKYNLFRNIKKIFSGIYDRITAIKNQFRHNIIVKFIKKPLRKTRNIARRFARRVQYKIKLVSLKRLLGEANIDIVEIIQEFKHKFKRIKTIIRVAIEVFFEVPPVIKEDLKRFVTYTTNLLHQTSNTFTNVYLKIIKYTYIKFFKIKNFIYTKHDWQYFLSNFYEIIKKISIFIIDFILYLIFTIYTNMRKLIMYSKLALFIECMLIIIIVILILLI